MAVETTSTARPSFDLKSAQLPVVAVALRDTDVSVLVADLAQRLADDPDFFDNDPVLIDLAHVREAEEAIDFAVLVEALRADFIWQLVRDFKWAGRKPPRSQLFGCKYSDRT